MSTDILILKRKRKMTLGNQGDSEKMRKVKGKEKGKGSRTLEPKAYQEWKSPGLTYSLYR